MTANVEVTADLVLAGLGLFGSFLIFLVTVAVLFGRLFQRVDTLEKDVNNAFGMIRDLTKEKKK